MKSAYKDHLLNECFDVEDLIRWTKTHMDNCNKEDHLDIYKKFCSLLEKVKENQMRAQYQEEFGRDHKVERTYLIDST